MIYTIYSLIGLFRSLCYGGNMDMLPLCVRCCRSRVGLHHSRVQLFCLPPLIVQYGGEVNMMDSILLFHLVPVTLLGVWSRC